MRAWPVKKKKDKKNSAQLKIAGAQNP